MSKTKARSHLLQLVDSDSDDGIGGSSLGATRQSKGVTTLTRTAPISQRAMPPKKGKAGRPAANRVAKPTPATTAATRNATKAAPARSTTRGRKRAAPTDEEEDDTEMADARDPPAAEPPAKKARGRPKKMTAEAEEPKTTAGARRGRKPTGKKPDPDTTAEEVSEIPETQQPDEEESDLQEEEDDGPGNSPVAQTPERAKPGRGKIGAPSSALRKTSQIPSPEKGDPALRRRLGEVTQKFENLEHRYRDLKEVAVRDAERNFDKLKKQSEEKSKAADQLIASLKAELAAQREASKEANNLRKQLDTSKSKAETLQTELTALATSLNDSKSEIKSLNLKLSVARNAEAAAAAAAVTASNKVPGSAMKGSTVASRLAATNASEATQAAQKKEDLYGDLTGLIVRSVKRGDDGLDMFDCIQTGRTGTLHFKLSVGVRSEDGEAYCNYTPQLDSNRDHALIAVLPDYLVDHISFPQAQVGKFYTRVLNALNGTGEV
ncbi:chromosome segregation protein Csm1/Pcs1-domain-containing protein [Dichotomopilus funicola]|uniref:Chromosome segregation protein Csm1/Pcs1-domain-containing protein n=1 Tax=Dichotomopilus funicola TaxID=1934379 RepID=A0AAN6UWR8_9PEZI|nr:chromosome segregation protein Csm1/Pcs1-domain-containing protein [Dichotomopilus funicola]